MNKFSLALLLIISVPQLVFSQNNNNLMNNRPKPEVEKTNEEWKKQLTPLQFEVCRLSATERPYTGEYTHTKTAGTYYCVCCGAKLFQSDTKFESGCGWPSFYDKDKENNIIEIPDNSLGMTRTEVRCKICNAHLGHVFNDGPPPTGLRYCINSAALQFQEKK